MKIDTTYKPATATALANRAPTRPQGATPASSDAVSLSTLAGAQQAGEKPPVNSARIQEIKDAIAQGRFKINPDAIASGLIQTACDLVNSQRKA